MILDEDTFRFMIMARVKALALDAARFVAGVYVVSKGLHLVGLL